jgi:hypothetical protein
MATFPFHVKRTGNTALTLSVSYPETTRVMSRSPKRTKDPSSLARLLYVRSSRRRSAFPDRYKHSLWWHQMWSSLFTSVAYSTSLDSISGMNRSLTILRAASKSAPFPSGQSMCGHSFVIHLVLIGLTMQSLMEARPTGANGNQDLLSEKRRYYLSMWLSIGNRLSLIRRRPVPIARIFDLGYLSPEQSCPAFPQGRRTDY